MHGVVIIGAAGRMGRCLIANVAASSTLKLVGAVERPDSPLIGTDAGAVAGCGELGVKISATLDDAIKNGADAIINFATTGVVDCAKKAVAAGACVVIGATTLTDGDRAQLNELAKQGGRLVVSGNMSVGVNLLFKLVREAATVLGLDYNVEVVEMHHNKKIDAPSGTALRLGQVVCEARKWEYERVVRNGRSGVIGKRPVEEIGMHSLRGGDVVGDHTVIFAAEGERVELSHRASNRNTFAGGALRAVEFLIAAKPGMYDMQDVLNLK